MADYYPLVARAVAGLDKNTGEARRALYERARTALVAQLRGVVPALTESEITRERLALEESIRKVEAEAARQSRLEIPRSDLMSPRPPPPPPRSEPKPPAPGPNPAEQSWTEPPRFEPSRTERPRYEPPPPPPPHEPAPAAPPLRAEPVMPGRRGGGRSFSDQASLLDQGLRGFRDDVGQSGDLGTSGNRAPPPPRDTFSAPSAPFSEPEKIEPRFETDDLGPAYRETPAAKPAAPRDSAAKARAATAPPRIPEGMDAPRKRLGLGFGGMLRMGLAVAILIALGILAVFAYRERARIADLYQSLRGPPSQVSRDATQTRPKINDRIGATGQPDSSTAPSGAPAAAVAQRVVLYEQIPNSTERKQYIGSVIWRTETVSPGPGLAPDLAVKADVEIPERRLRMSWTMRRNSEQTLPASHTIEIIFNTAADFPPGGIADVPGVLMEQAEQSRGVPLTGLRVKVTNGFFLVGLSAVETEAQRNIQLLKERPWVDIPLVYNDGNRALLAIEKGVPGDRVFADAFAAWKQ
jgi:hypothetical protein